MTERFMILEADVLEALRLMPDNNADLVLLDAAQTIVDKALEDVVSYEEDSKVAVLLPRPVQDAEGFVVRFDPPTLPEEASP